MGKIRNLCMTQLVRMKKIKEPDMYTWIFSSGIRPHYPDPQCAPEFPFKALCRLFLLDEHCCL